MSHVFISQLGEREDTHAWSKKLKFQKPRIDVPNHEGAATAEDASHREQDEFSPYSCK